MTTPVNQKTLTTLDGKYQVGSKRPDEKTASKREIKIFDKIDTDHNGELSAEEICNRRDKEVDLRIAAGIGTAVAGAAMAVVEAAFTIPAEIATFGAATPGIYTAMAADCSLVATGGAMIAYNLEKRNESDEYRQQWGL